MTSVVSVLAPVEAGHGDDERDDGRERPRRATENAVSHLASWR